MKFVVSTLILKKYINNSITIKIKLKKKNDDEKLKGTSSIEFEGFNHIF